MTIYVSDRAMPYVYKLVHKTTGQFYIGSRYAESLHLPSHLDLPQYKTSSKVIRDIGFDNFDWQIIAEFFDGDDAWDYEQELIAENFNDPLILNARHFHRKGKCRTIGPMSEETKAKISAAKKGKTTALKGKPSPLRGKPKTQAHIQKWVESRSKTYLVTHPDGHQTVEKNLKKFCIEHGLQQGHMSSVVNGKLKQHKGYVAVFAELAQ
jgi:hypothetical protein